ncbi:MAG: carbohydrate ABC transporter permease [Trueperaceae bacterium]
MVTTALKPDWQIFARPIILFPQQWHKVDAGDSVRLINLYRATQDGEKREVVELGSRRYTSALAVENLPTLEVAPANEISKASIKTIADIQVNVRSWQGKEVIAVGRSGDALLVVPTEALQGIVTLPLDELNSGKRETVTQGEYKVQARQIEIDGVQRMFLTLGPQTQQTTVTPSEIAGHAKLVFANELSEGEAVDVGNSQVETVTFDNRAHVLLEQSPWQPTLDLSVVQSQAEVVPASAFVETEQAIFNGGVFAVGTLEGKNDQVARVLTLGNTVVVLPLNVMQSIVMVPGKSLQNPLVARFENSNIRYKDFTLPSVRDESINFEKLPKQVVLLGAPQDMSLIAPVNEMKTAFDTAGTPARVMTPKAKWKNISDALSRQIANVGFLTFFKNSFIITILSIIGHLFSCTVVAYAFARMRAPGKNVLFTIVIATMMLPDFITLIPVYTIFRDLGLVDTLVPLYIRSFFGNAFLIFLLRQFFSTLPRDLEDAAMIDGATRVQTFTRIMLPLVTPALTTVAIFTFLWRWNDLLQATIYLNSPKNYTVAIGLNVFKDAYKADFTLLMAAATIVMLPTVLLFFFTQRFFIEGITLTGSKG